MDDLFWFLTKNTSKIIIFPHMLFNNTQFHMYPRFHFSSIVINVFRYTHTYIYPRFNKFMFYAT